jgi:glycerol-3-phosphate dehydrogenase (NAD(P)+)
MGAGAWGEALAIQAARCGHETGMWSRRAVRPDLLRSAEAVILAVSAQSVREVLASVALPRDIPILIAAKGIERGTGEFMHEVVAEVAPDHPTYILSGPSFAADVVQGLPTAVTLAGQDLGETMRWAEALSTPTFRIYGTDDILGVAIGGAMKNVLAIACGIADGRGLGDSARAALVTRGFAELMRFGQALGGRPETLVGLSGLGDLMLTATSEKSRNAMFGRRIGGGMTVTDAIAASNGTVEGAYSAAVAVDLAEKHRIDMPIARSVHAIVDQGSSPPEEIEKLLSRPIRPEMT